MKPTPSTVIDRLGDLISALPRARVLVVGDLVLDQFITGRSDRISREAPVPIVRETGRDRRPGGAANVAANLRAVGARTRVVGVLGDDDAGRALRALMREAGVSCGGLVTVKGRATEAKTRILAGGLSLTPQQVVRLDQGSESPPDEAVLRRMVAGIEKATRQVDVIAVSDYGLGVCALPLRQALRRAARKIPVIVDSRFDLKRYAGVTVVKPNAPELEAATGRKVRDAKSARAVARHLASELKLEAVLLTRGHEGACLARAAGRVLNLLPHGPAEAVDVTGAGDTVLACFCAALAAGGSYEDAARVANIGGGIVVQKSGTAVVSGGELAAELCPDRFEAPLSNAQVDRVAARTPGRRGARGAKRSRR